MLVKKSIVERWYRTDSWVYKNFAYLFQNPLWSKRIPQGFSVCPYFWLNLFSLFIFRPFCVMPIHYVIMPIIRAIGYPASAFDDFCRSMFSKLNMIPYCPPPGAGVAFALLWSVVLGAITYIGYMITTQFYPYVTQDAGGMFGFWAVVSFIALWLVIGLHKKFTETECKTFNYLYVWFAILVAAMCFFVPTEALGMVKSFFGGIGWVFAQLWIGICMLFAWLGKWLWAGVSWKPVNNFVLPWPAYIALIGIFGYFCDRIMQWSESRNYNKDESNLYKQRNRDAWVSLFIRTLCVKPEWKNGFNLSNYCTNRYKELAVIDCRYTIYRRAMEILFQDKMAVLQEKYPLMPRGVFTEIASAGCMEMRFAKLNHVMNVSLNVTEQNMDSAIMKAMQDAAVKQTIDDLAEHYMTKDNDKAKKKEARKNSAMRLMCLRITGMIGIFVGCIKRGLTAFFVGIWTFLVYLWMLIKAKKKGACPYFRFTDATLKK